MKNYTSRIISLATHVRDKSLDALIFFITGKCNSFCRNCFYRENLNHNDDLSYEELDKIIQTIPPFKFFQLSGGEPFMRKDLPEIVFLFRKYCGISQVTIPTNGLLEKEIMAAVERIFKLMPKIPLLISFSLDGLGETHDRIRGVKSGFDKTIRCIKKLVKLRTEKKYQTLNIQINSVIFPETIRNLNQFIDFIKDELWYLDDYLFELVRENLFHSKVVENLIPENELDLFYKKVRLLQYDCAKKKIAKSKSIKEHLRLSMRLTHLRLIQRIQFNSYYGKKQWGFPCIAGHTVGVIEHDGTIRLCELRNKIGNLKDFNYDFPKLWNSSSAIEERKQIKKDGCERNCTHICFIRRSLEKSPKTIFYSLPREAILNHWRFIRNLDEYSV